MNTHLAVGLGRPAGSDEHGRALRRWWSLATAFLLAAVFLEAVFAGALLSGAAWARAAHGLTAGLVIAATAAAGLIGVVTLRRIPHGPRLGAGLLALAALAFLQTVLGALSAKGANLLWAHVPLGVALVGLAAQAAASARRLGAD
jgi:hypothetical protein